MRWVIGLLASAEPAMQDLPADPVVAIPAHVCAGCVADALCARLQRFIHVGELCTSGPNLWKAGWVPVDDTCGNHNMLCLLLACNPHLWWS